MNQIATIDVKTELKQIKVHAAAKADLLAEVPGLSDESATKIIEAIKSGLVANVAVTY